MIFDDDSTRQLVLEKFLEICQLDGWNDEALNKAITTAGIEEKFSKIIFENGCLDVADFYIKSQNRKCGELMAQENFATKKIRQKISLFLYARFEVEKNNRIAMRRLANFYINPRNFTKFEIGFRPLLQGFRACFVIADFIWKSINDQSTDFNFYTKRLTLAKIILRSFLVFLKDESQNLERTKNFIDAQIDGVMKFEKYKSLGKSKIKNISQKSRQHFKELFLDENGAPKSPRQIVRSLPFVRLIK